MRNISLKTLTKRPDCVGYKTIMYVILENYKTNDRQNAFVLA